MALAEGRISEKEMPNQEGIPGVNKALIRYAPSFVAGGAGPVTGGAHSYTNISLGRFLGMIKSGGTKATDRLSLALDALALEEEGYLKHPERFSKLADLKVPALACAYRLVVADGRGAL